MRAFFRTPWSLCTQLYMVEGPLCGWLAELVVLEPALALDKYRRSLSPIYYMSVQTVSYDWLQLPGKKHTSLNIVDYIISCLYKCGWILYWWNTSSNGAGDRPQAFGPDVGGHVTPDGRSLVYLKTPVKQAVRYCLGLANKNVRKTLCVILPDSGNT
jgi:hypothetical protein